jgi:hypothetical protein
MFTAVNGEGNLAMENPTFSPLAQKIIKSAFEQLEASKATERPVTPEKAVKSAIGRLYSEVKDDGTGVQVNSAMMEILSVYIDRHADELRIAS